MTTIAYRDGVLAADSLATRDGVVTGEATKIRRLADGRLAAMIGSAGSAQAILRWIEAGEKGDQPKGDGAVVIFTAEGAKVYDEGQVEEISRAPFKAYGCGSPIAIGAMAAGATAEEAVRIACEWDTCTGGEILVLRLTAGRVGQ